ncbi:hypothetical protein C9374_009086 [Naegleria lovaniensis]|uniref:AAA+ ATPase domain-containing protein n=1 Tax=Naegleria lovaniensis TaxID=51637 RepID=A0AA88GIS7_NAELO|nr:uncharacterized protein C9374_009086 [Naegleria lovaniensis]KAG2377570.1 hypothetical protein C9374_009086 [Naegleria lovaniensis]
MSSGYDKRFEWLFEKIADAFHMDKETIASVGRSKENTELIGSFLDGVGNSKCLLWFFFSQGVNDFSDFDETLTASSANTYSKAQTVISFGTVDTESTVASIKSPRSSSDGPVFLVSTDFNANPLINNAICIYFVKEEITTNITMNNIEDIAMGVISGSKGLMKELKDRLENLYVPQLRKQSDWGELSQSNDKKEEIIEFLENVEKFVQNVSEAKIALESSIRLEPPKKFSSIESKPKSFLKTALNRTDVISSFEEAVSTWMGDIDALLNEVTAVREEDDESGPAAELDYWKSRMAKFNSITDQLRGKVCKTVLSVLKAKKSPILAGWKNIDMRITDAANEAKDNVKYLYILEKFSEPLYKSDPVQMINTLPALINAIKMMQSIARYYNTSERMTALFVKITNQMIICSKKYLMKDGRLWEQDTEKLIEKFKACIDLNEAYQHYYRKTKSELQLNPFGKQFDFSESAIFGKFDQFCWRIQKLIDLFTTFNQFSYLQKSTIEGLEPILKQFNKIITVLKRKKYDFLDYRKTIFDNDYVEFNNDITKLELELMTFINNSFSDARTTRHSLELLEQFKKVLKQENLQRILEEKYKAIFNNYSKDVEMIKNIYEEKSKRPTLPRNAPPIAGNIAWSRQLMRRLEEPMELFKKTPAILDLKDSKKTIKLYNKIGRALIGFESLWMEKFDDALETAREGLLATVLVEQGNQLYVNFDSDLKMLMNEVKYLQIMELDLPESATSIFNQQERLLYLEEGLKFMVKEYYRVMGMQDELYKGILRPMIKTLDEKIRLGKTTITWLSVRVDSYIEDVMKFIKTMEETLEKANDILTFRLKANIDSITKTYLISFTHEVRSIQQFLSDNEKFSKQMALDIDIKNQEIESAASDLISIITFKYTDEEKYQVAKDCRTFKIYFEERMLEAVSNCLRNSVKHLKDKISQDKRSNAKPVFNVQLALSIPNIVLQPSLEEIQKCVNKCARVMLESTQHIFKWSQDKSKERKNIFSQIGEDKTTIKGFLQLTGAIAGLSSKLNVFIAKFQQYDFLWKQDRSESISSFVEGASSGAFDDEKKVPPSLEDFEKKIKYFSDLEKELQELDQYHQEGSLLVDLKPIKTALTVEASQWKFSYGQALNLKAKAEMESLLTYMEETTNNLKRDVSDIEGINNVMNVLNDLRERESSFDLAIKPINEAYEILKLYNIKISKEELEQVEDNGLEFKWKALIALSREVMSKFQKIGPGFRRDLEQKVKAFKTEVSEFKKLYDEQGPMEKGINPRVAKARLTSFKSAFDEKMRKWKTYSMGERLFKMKETEYPDLVKISKELDWLSGLYDLYTEVIVTVNSFEDIMWNEIDIDEMSNVLNNFNVRCKNMHPALRKWDAYIELKDTIENFLNTLPLLEKLNQPCVTQRHWKQISDLCKRSLDYKNPEFKIRDIIEAKLVDHKDDIEEIVNAANRELNVEKKLEEIKEEWKLKKFVLGDFKNRGKLVLKDTQDLMQSIEDTQLALSTLLGDLYNEPFKPEIQQWMVKLSVTQSVVDDWLQIQSLWIYMFYVFTGGDIGRELPHVFKRFQNVDKSWVKIMSTAESEPNVIKLCYHDEMLRDLLPHLKTLLEKCQRDLSGYLEKKRMLFPRFYFLSDKQILEILGQGSDPSSIQKHLLSIFSNIAEVEFDSRQKNHIIAMKSYEGEYVPLVEPVICEDNIEVWLNRLVSAMQETVHELARNMSSTLLSDLAVVENNSFGRDKLTKFIGDIPCSQLALLGLQLLWTWDSEMAIRNSRDRTSMANAKKKFETIFNHLVTLTTNPKLTALQRTRLETLITIHIHQVEIFQELFKKKVKNVNDFEWTKRTRFYWKAEQDKCVISITDVDFEYCNEYLGCTERLVITQLTDRIYISCAQAMGMFLGGAPAGPAGTGKTETTKDMGRTMGKYFITINCSDQGSVHSMGTTFKGIAQSGAWCGFDEINRVKLEVLSVVAAQVACIFDAMRNRASKFTFTDGSELVLDPTCACFITFNPGYAGRTELPENMKALFRTIAVVQPDRRIIMKVRLAASGFLENQPLSKKFDMLYKLCEQQLSNQNHYDFGLRNILSVLRTCGVSLRSESSSGEKGGNEVKKDETKVLMRVLQDMNNSKLVDEDSTLFKELLKDLFPNETCNDAPDAAMSEAIDSVIEKHGLVNHSPWKLKILQLYEQYKVRHGLCCMGPSGSGKSAAINVLCEALGKIGIQTKIKKMNPKSITSEQMFGTLDKGTNDWTDGIFTSLWRETMDKKKEYSWILLDGPVDTIWIENLNTVLDDTKSLTLANGDRLNMPKTLKLVFEVGSLDNASPATVSRMGMVYIGSTILGWEPIFLSWIKKHNKRSNNEIEKLTNLFNKHVTDILTFIENECSPSMFIGNSNIVATTLKILDGMFTNFTRKSFTDSMIEKLFIFSVIWGIGGTLESSDRIKFHTFLEKDCKLSIPSLDSGDTIYEFTMDENGDWRNWKFNVPHWKYPTDYEPLFNSILIPTVDNVRTDFLIQLMAKQEHSVLLIGTSGTAKTVTIKKYLNELDKNKFKNKLISFSSATTPGIVQNSIFTSLEKRLSNKVFGPPLGRKMFIFIDDINMPEINEWGDQITNEIVRQVIEDGGFYSLDSNNQWLKIVDVQFLAAMNQPGLGKNDIPDRLKRHFAIFNLTVPSTKSIDHIFTTIIEGHYCKARGFSDEVMQCASTLPELTRKLWMQTKEKMLPTPNKFHYVFNLRDLSRIFQGLLLGKSEVIQNHLDLLHLWRHEADRVLHDKFIEDADREWFQNTSKGLLKEHYGEDIARAVKSKLFVDFLRKAESHDENVVSMDDMDYEAPPPEDDPKIYEPVDDYVLLYNRLDELLNKYNEKHKKEPLDIVLFDFAILHITRISRIIRSERGNALLVGVGGSGKQSLTKLASYIAGYKTFKIQVTKNYHIQALLDDLKKLYKIAVLESPVTFIFTDNDIKDEQFLEYINMMLTSGDIPGLFTKEEREMMIGELRPIAIKSDPSFMATPENLFNFFIDRARDNLHMVLCFSPIGDQFRNRSRKFPGIISGCTIDWFDPWPKEALKATADKFIGNFDLATTDSIKNSLVLFMKDLHYSVNELTVEYLNKYRRNTYVTPKTYLSFLNIYRKIYVEKLQEIEKKSNNISKGLEKLQQAKEDVREKGKELEQKERELQIAQASAQVLVDKVQKETKAAEEQGREIQKRKEKQEKEVKIVQKERDEVTHDLKNAEPHLQAAERALDKITSASLSKIKKYQTPPEPIMRVMDTILIFRGLPIDKTEIEERSTDPKNPRKILKPSWRYAKEMMNNINFMQSLLKFDKDSISDEQVELVAPYMDDPTLTVENVLNSSEAAASLWEWVQSMVNYHNIAKVVDPKRRKVEEAETKLQIAQAQLKEMVDEYEEKQKELRELNRQLEEALNHKKQLEDDALQTRKRMEAAEALIHGLSSEEERWRKDQKQFQLDIHNLIGDIALASVFLTYSGPFNQEFRSTIVEQLCFAEFKNRGIPFSEKVNVIDFITHPTTIGEWRLQGLPNDDYSTQNAIIVTTGSRYPLLIDPQGQGKEWIKHKEANDLVITTLSADNLKEDLEKCVATGRPLLIEDIGEELDPILDSVLDMQLIKKGKRPKIKIGENEVPYNENFRLYITTKLPNPRYTPEMFAKVSVIDFTVTAIGLEDQLLAIVINKEMIELEEKRTSLLNDIQECNEIMEQCEKELLEKLSENREKSLVDDTELIDILTKTKEKNRTIKEKLMISEETNRSIQEAREEFRPVANRGSIMYFVITELSLINCMYQVSLSQFIKLFIQAIDESEKDRNNKVRIDNIINYSTFFIYKYVQRGLYEKHRIVFALLLALKIDLKKPKSKGKGITMKEFNCLIRAGNALQKSDAPKIPFSWIEDKTWLNIFSLTKADIPEFRNIHLQIENNEDQWKKFYFSASPENEAIPDFSSLSTFHRLLLIRCIRMDRTMNACSSYIIDTLGQQFVDSISLNLEETWKESSPITPIVCLLSQGSDLTGSIEKLAQHLKMTIDRVSMGQGQKEKAQELIKNAIANGGWVLLQNCHLGIDYLEILEKTLMDLSKEDYSDKSFRVWITTEPTPLFPINLLQMSIKVTDEPPTGIRAGLAKAYNWLTQEALGEVPENRKLIYSTCFLHSVLIERKKFGPLGWCVPYEFNQSDLECSLHFLINYLNENDIKKIQWNTIRYMICDVQYGGRVTDAYDSILLSKYGNKFYGQHVFSKDFTFYCDREKQKVYEIPEKAKIDDYRKYIHETLPLFDPPEVFGLHQNAEIVHNEQKTNFVLSTIQGIQPKESAAGSGETREDIVLKDVKSYLEKIPEEYDSKELKKYFKKIENSKKDSGGANNPMVIFLKQEIDRMKIVLKLVRRHLQDLKLAIAGTIVMSAELQNIFDSLYDAKVPQPWQKVSWESHKLGVWIEQLQKRHEQFMSWLQKGQPKLFWISGFFNIAGFLTAVKQESTRKHAGWSLESVSLKTEITSKDALKDSFNAPEDAEGVFVYGLYLEGAIWDRKAKQLSDVPSSELSLVHELPIIHLSAISSMQGSDMGPKEYVCPVYKNPDRTHRNYIFDLHLKTSEDPSKWTLRGVAALCSKV